MSYLRIFEAFIKFGKTNVLREFLKKYFDKDATAKLINSNVTMITMETTVAFALKILPSKYCFSLTRTKCSKSNLHVPG